MSYDNSNNERRDFGNFHKLLNFEIHVGGISLTQKAFFAKNLAVMIKAGLPLEAALDLSRESVSGKFKKVLESVHKSVASGHPFFEALNFYPKVFSPFFRSSVYAGEESGTLEENLTQIAVQLFKEKELAAKIKSALVYPAVILGAALILGFFLSFTVLPKLIPMFEGMKINLPLSTKILIWFTHFMDRYGAWVFSGFLVFLFSSVTIGRKDFAKPFFHWFLLNLPLVKSVSRPASISRAFRTLGILLKSGLNIDEALKITEESSGNYYYKKSIAEISKRVSRGVALAESLKDHKKFYPNIAVRMIGVGEESGKLDETLIYLADFYENEVDGATKTLSTAMEPILLLVIGLVVGFLALSIITPIYTITGNLNTH